MGSRTCAQCGETKPLAEFSKDASQPLGYGYSCKRCKGRASREWKKRNPDKVNAQNKRWRERNPERAKEIRDRTVAKHADSRREALRKWREGNLEHHHDSYLLRVYGFPRGEYARLLAEQGGVCAVCSSADPGRNGRKKWQWFAVDHCHKTGQNRGLLCYKCNTALGHLDDDPEKMRKLIAYLLKYSPD